MRSVVSPQPAPAPHAEVRAAPPAPLAEPRPGGVDFTQSLGIDPRSLALFRIAMALVLLSDLWLRIANMEAFYTDAGILPRAAQIEFYAGLPDLLSLHMWNGTLGGQAVLLAIQVGAALALLVGYRTWAATFVSWVLLVSLHNRNPMVLQGGDVLLRLMLFWALFLPLHARASLDRWLAPRAKPNDENSLDAKYPNAPFVSMGTFAALLQVCFMYWFSWALKTDASWRVDGTAVGYALSIDQLNTPLGRWLLGYPDLMRILGLFTINLERWGPLVALVPFWRPRLLMVLVFTGFHWALGLCLTLGIFTWIAPTAWLLFVPTAAWDWLEARFSFARLRAATTRLVEKLRARGWRARAPRALPLWRNASGQLTATFFVVYVFAWNLRALDFNRYEPYFPARWNWIGESLRLDQVWSMFAPFPLKEDGWFVMPATLNDGQKVNLMNGGAPMDWTKPANLSGTFRDAQWQKYLLNLWSLENAPHRGHYVAYIVRKWNESHPPEQSVKSTDLVYMQQNNLEGFRKDKVKAVVTWRARY